jgi:hypothetical protein
MATQQRHEHPVVVDKGKLYKRQTDFINIIRVTISSRMRCTGHVTRMDEMTNR